MDLGAVSGAAKVPNVSSRLDLRASEGVNANLSEERHSGELIVTESLQNKVAHDGGLTQERKKVEGTTGKRPHGISCVNETADSMQTSRSGRRKRNLSDVQDDETKQIPSAAKRKRRNSDPESSTEVETEKKRNKSALLRTIPEKMRKYFAQRHRLFHLYDEGIELDEEAWYSVTPEKIAAHIASRFAHLKVVVDLYSCVGGNSIQFAKAGLRVIAVEIDQQKIDMARNNAAIYDVEDRIDFRKGDVFELLSSLRDQFDSTWGIFLSPPWGGPNYVNRKVFDVSVFKKAVDQAMQVSESVAILVPRNISIQNLRENFDHCEVEENYLGEKLKTITLYFGALEGRGVTLDRIEEF